MDKICKGLLILSILWIVGSCHTTQTVEGDIAIINGLIADGTGSMLYEADLVVQSGVITWIGDVEDVLIQVDSTIDASDLLVTPGFIDLHAHGDPLKTPGFDNFLAMGVTTIALGMDGSSVPSSDMGDWMKKLDSTALGVNILPFVGHGTVRTESGIGMSDNVTDDQLGSMLALVDHALNIGCWGLSMGLEYFPGYHADSVELEALAKTVGVRGRLITSHIRNEDDQKVDQSLDEMGQLASFCNVNISHLKVVYGKGEQRALSILEKLDGISDADYNLTADLYPYTASYTGIGIVFPSWAKQPKKYKEIKEERGAELLQFLREKIRQRNGPEATLFGTGPYAGKTLQDLVDEYDLPYERILMDIIGPYGASAAYFVMDESLQEALLAHPKVSVASDGSPTMRHPRGHGTFSKIIEKYVVQDTLMKLEEAIYKMSGLPASTVGLQDRGVVKEGKSADLLIFDPSRIRTRATFEEPHRLSEGVDIIIVNGEIVKRKEHTLKDNGRLLRALEGV